MRNVKKKTIYLRSHRSFGLITVLLVCACLARILLTRIYSFSQNIYPSRYLQHNGEQIVKVQHVDYEQIFNERIDRVVTKVRWGGMMNEA